MTATVQAKLERARAALLEAAAEAPLVEPLRAMLLRAERELGAPFRPETLVEHWSTRALGNPKGSDRYRWELTHKKGTGVPAYAGPVATWSTWRSSEQQVFESEPFEFEERLTGLIVACECAELLSQLDELPSARLLLDEAYAVLRRDVAACALERNAWADSFGLWCVTRYPRTFESVQPLVVAVAESHALRARESGGIVRGTRYPLHERPLVSATAQLASTLLRLGSHTELVARAARFVAEAEDASGGFGDAPDAPDLLTTLAAADLLSSSNPDYEAARTVEFVLARQEPNGMFRALGPEMPWLTLELLRFIESAELPFAERFRFPHVPEANLDRKTGLPFYAYFAELSRLFRELPGICSSMLEVGFIDLIGFREFNNRFGQTLGDEVLSEFARALEELRAARVVRDGGDEFLVIGAPQSSDLEGKLRRLQERWPSRFRARFGTDAPAVLARALVGRARAAELTPAREHLGRAIGALKSESVDPELGILRWLELTR